MRRVAVTGIGIVSSIGNNANEVIASLREARSGIVAAPEYAELGFRCQVHGAPADRLGGAWSTAAPRASWPPAPATPTSPWSRRSPTPASSEAEVSNERTGLIVGSGGPSTRAIVEAADMARAKGVKRIGPFAVPKAMSSGPSATLSTWFKIRGLNFSITSACATSTHCIGVGAEQIALRQPGHRLRRRLRGARLDPLGAVRRDGRDVGQVQRHARPRPAAPTTRRATASSSPAAPGIVVLEELERAKARGAKIYGEIVGYAANSDGHDMVAPVRRGRGALHADGAGRTPAGGKIDYLNPHGTGTPIGDVKEMEAVREVFGEDAPLISSTKSLTGHSLGAAGAQEAIYCLLMMGSGFVAESANIETLDPAFADLPIVRERLDRPLETVMSNSFGFGGTNGCLVMSRV